jgi:hypothetical protein
MAGHCQGLGSASGESGSMASGGDGCRAGEALLRWGEDEGGHGLALVLVVIGVIRRHTTLWIIDSLFRACQRMPRPKSQVLLVCNCRFIWLSGG